MQLSPELRRRIYEEERIRLEAQARFQEEIRLRRQGTVLTLRLLLMLLFFAVGFAVSEFYLRQSQAIPESATQAAQAGPVVSQLVLDEITRTLNRIPEAAVCVSAVGGAKSQIRATIELAGEMSREAARRFAMAQARVVGATLKRYALAVPAYVEVVSPKRWHGMALYEGDTEKIGWDACPGRCEQEGTEHVRRCSP